MNVTPMERDSVEIAYLPHLGPYGEPVYRFWQETFHPWARANGLLDQPRYGISHDDPVVTAAERCRYDAGVEILRGVELTGDALTTTLPGGRYAVLPFRGDVTEIPHSWNSLLRDWLPSSGLQLDGRPALEYYSLNATCDPDTGVFECEICVPVTTL